MLFMVNCSLRSTSWTNSDVFLELNLFATGLQWWSAVTLALLNNFGGAMRYCVAEWCSAGSLASLMHRKYRYRESLQNEIKWMRIRAIRGSFLMKRSVLITVRIFYCNLAHWKWNRAFSWVYWCLKFSMWKFIVCVCLIPKIQYSVTRFSSLGFFVRLR
jgi:hypothetical protein